MPTKDEIITSFNKKFKTFLSKYKRDAAFVILECIDSYSFGKPSHFMEVTMWHNGEGFDVSISANTDQNFSMTWGQFRALKKLIKELDQP